MKYERMSEAVFIDRPNRFIANIEHEGRREICHVKNTGRCRELLLPGARVLVQRSENPARRTAYDLISVYKGKRLINMDAAAPNAVFGEYLRSGGLGFVPELVRAESRRGDSRFDFYFEHEGRAAYAEVKGVTLEEGGAVRFPDAPTERGTKHLRGLIDCVRAGYEAYAVFVVQMDGVEHFEPNYRTDPDFCRALLDANAAGVRVLAYTCAVGFDSLDIIAPLPVLLSPEGA